MDLWRLRVFCSVVSTGGFSAAAKELRLTQPSVSAHIKELESHFNCRLIDRVNRQAKPTRAGEILYRSARKLIREYEKTETALSEYHGRFEGRLLIGGSNIPGEYILPAQLGAFRKAYPNVTVSVLIKNTLDIVQQVLDDTIELGFVGATVKEPGISQEPCYSDELKLVVPAGSTWVKGDAIELQELEMIPFITRFPGSGTMKTFLERIRQNGFDGRQLQIVAELGSNTAVIQGIRNGLGASVLSSLAVRDELAKGTLRAIRLEGVALQRSFFLTCRNNRSLTPLAARFIDFLKHDSREFPWAIP